MSGYCGQCQRPASLCTCISAGKPAVNWPVTTCRQYRMECVSCQGSGYSQRATYGTTNLEKCKGCEGSGFVTVTETTTGGAS